MQIRDLKDEDIPKLKVLHEKSGLEYDFPNLKNIATAKVAVDENDEPIAAVITEKVLTPYLWLDSDYRTPAWRMEAIKQLHYQTELELRNQPIKEAYIFIPPHLKAFARRITKLDRFRPVKWLVFHGRIQ